MSSSDVRRPTVVRAAPRSSSPARVLAAPRGPAELDEAERADRVRRELAAARQEGHRAGRTEVDSEIATRIDDTVAWLTAQAESVRAARVQFLMNAERECLGLALAIATKILGRAPGGDITPAVSALERVLVEAGDAPAITLRVSPDDLAAFESIAEAITRPVGSPDGVRWIPDRRVGRGGVVVETEAGKIDARIDTQLEQVASLLDEVWNDDAR